MQRKKKQPNEKEQEVKKQPENGIQAELTRSAEEAERRHQKILEKIQEFRPMDDDFLRAMLRDDLPLAQMMFRIIMNKDDLVLTSFHTQEDMKQIAGARSICLDAYAVDGEKRHYDLEIQRADAGANPHRARYHSSVLDVENLRAGQDFRKLPDTYVIFITENDYYKAGEPVYVIRNMNLTLNQPFEDGTHILYVNGKYRGDSDIGRLMHDFCCTKAEDMNFELMAERTRYLKENPKGVSNMCKVMDDLRVQSFAEGKEEGREEGREEQARAMAENFYKMGMSIEQIAKGSGYGIETIKQWLTPKAG